MSEEASNANFVVPWANIIASCSAVILGTGKLCSKIRCDITGASIHITPGFNIVVAFTMGEDLGTILADPTGQPFATVRRSN